MFKQLFLPLIGVAAFIVVVGFLIKESSSLKIPGLTFPQQPTAVKKQITIGGKTLSVEIARTEAERELGLGNRTFLDPETGMLFVFDGKDVHPGFWMKGMLIPLDIIWIDDGKIAKIDRNIQPPKEGANGSDLKIYYPLGNIDYVLEVNAGFSDKNNLKVDNSLDLSGI